MANGRYWSGFWHDGERYELRDWYDLPTVAELGAGASLVRSEAQARGILGAVARSAGPSASFGLPPRDVWGDEPQAGVHRRVDRLIDELRSGRRLLVMLHTRPSAGGGGPIHAPVVDLIDLAAPDAQEDTWVEFVFQYPDGTKVSGLDYVLVHPTQTREPGTLAKHGTITRRGVSPGDYTVVIKEIEHAVWAKHSASCHDELKVIARTSGYPDTTPATVRLYRERTESPGDELATVEARVHGDVIEATLRYDHDPTSDPEHDAGAIGLIAEVSLDGGRVWAKTQRALALQIPTLRAVRWSHDRADAGDTVDIVVEAAGYPPDTQVVLEVWRLDHAEGDTKVCALGPLPLSRGEAIARCAYASADSADATIDACGEYYVVATIDASVTRTVSSGLLWCAYEAGSQIGTRAA